MKLAFSTNAFRHYTLDDALRIISNIGYDGVEIMCDSPHAWPPDLDDHRIQNIAEKITERGLKISNLNAFMMCEVQDFHHPSWIEDDDHFRSIRVDHTIRSIQLAHQWGAKTVSTEPGGPLDGMNEMFAMSRFCEEIRKAADIAEASDVQLLVEPEPGLLIETSSQFQRFVEQVGHPSIGLNFDLGHFYCVGEDPAELIRLFDKRIAHVHLEDIAEDRTHFHLPPGQGAIDFDSVFEAFHDIGYDGWITVELYPFQEDGESVAEDAFTYLQKYF